MNNAAAKAPLVKADTLAKTYHDGQRELRVLRDVSMELAEGETLAIVGASGCGKSTLLHLLGGLDVPTYGQISLGGRPLAGLKRHELSEIRLGFSGFVFQAHHLLGEFNAVENVMLPMLARRMSRGAARERALDLMEKMGVAARSTHRPPQLSGGEQQRVAIARALANEPRLILADEPTGNLDEETGRQVADVIFEAAKGRGLILVTHDPALAARADRTLRLHEGKLQESSEN